MIEDTLDTRVTIFMVEDESAIRRLATTILERAGYRVVTAEDASRALSVADAMERPPDLLVTDLVLPGGSGESLAARLRERWSGIPVILVSGHPDRAGELPEGTAFLAKPFGPADLLAAVRGRLENGGEGGA